MASGNISQHTTTRPARKPSPARVIQSYLHICDTQGKRSAATKTGEIYGISHMTVRRYVAAYEAAQDLPEQPPELQYVPPPGGYPTPIVPHIDRESLTEHSQSDDTTCEEFMSSEKYTNEAGPQESTSVTAEPSQPEPSQTHSAELETPMVAAPETAQPTIVRERIVERVVYRVPVDRRDSPVLVWARDNMPLAQLLIALAITMVLIGVANLG